MSDAVTAAFVLDPAILESPRIGAPLTNAFFAALASLRGELRARGSDLALLAGEPERELIALARRLDAQALFYNRDYEPQATARDRRVEAAFASENRAVFATLDHVVYGAEIVTPERRSYTVYSPYRRRWLERHRSDPRPPRRVELEGRLLDAAAIGRTAPLPPFEGGAFNVTPEAARTALERFIAPGGAIERYDRDRDRPDLDGVSRLSPHLRAGTIGARTCFARAFAVIESDRHEAHAGTSRWIDEFIWREFYAAVLAHHPHVADGPFVRKLERVPWNAPGAAFEAWCAGRTGYPIVDAAMRQLNETGWMHNRLRMVAASFLTKDLLIDWRHGERYFEQRLIDADLAQNNGGWQWCASTGTDAMPSFRIFNPTLQGKKFDPRGDFVRRMIPELHDVPDAVVHEPWKIGAYLPPIVDHARARVRALEAYAARTS